MIELDKKSIDTKEICGLINREGKIDIEAMEHLRSMVKYEDTETYNRVAEE